MYLKSARAAVQGTAPSLGSVARGYEWAMYRFNPATQALDSAAVLLSVPLGGSAVVAYSAKLPHW